MHMIEQVDLKNLTFTLKRIKLVWKTECSGDGSREF